MWNPIKFVMSKPGASLVLGGSLLFVLIMLFFVLLGNLLPTCNSVIMPCTLSEQGSCLCSVRGNDGTCWLRMKQTKRCFKSTMQIKSGVCEGSYETSLCATNQEEVDIALNNLATAVTELHPMAEGTCNVTYTRENDRCRLPLAVQKERAFYHPECCRAPVTTCANDLDCCNCGQSAPVCSPPLKCMITGMRNGTMVSESTECDPIMDACATFIYAGCTESTCDDNAFTIPMDPLADPACCSIPGNCTCRRACQPLSDFPGCPCLGTVAGCVRKQCVQSDRYFADGGVSEVLTDLGAHAVKLCYSDNCND